MPAEVQTGARTPIGLFPPSKDHLLVRKAGVTTCSLLGELGNFMYARIFSCHSYSATLNYRASFFSAFKWWCMQRGRKFEEKSITYALYSQIIREGGYRVPIIMRFSAIPGHRKLHYIAVDVYLL